MKQEHTFNFDHWGEALPKVSCICITFGRPHLIGEAIESFLRQNYQGAKELIILNDHPDIPLTLPEHPEIVLVNHSERFTSIGLKRNEATRLATGSVIFPWDDNDHPLHPAYSCLSATHRSDYLRCYFMHFHGGGYTDIKEPCGKWSHAFDHLDEDAHSFLVGYREVGPEGVAQAPPPVGQILREQWYRLPGCGSFVGRRDTPLTSEWLKTVEKT